MKAKRVAEDKCQHGFRDPKREGFRDVKFACNRFLRERIARGEM